VPLEIESPGGARPAAGAITIGLVNNMPDAALTATESQFTRLLASASDARQVRLRFAYLPEVPRGPEAAEHVARTYWTINDLLREPPEALIVTGTEPRSAELAAEPYWASMVELLEWAQTHTASSIWSCLAAHAAVQALDGIRRRRLPEKRFGVFAHTPLPSHPLLRAVGGPVLTPHSRWNELPEPELRAAGYVIASSSPETGADLFVRRGRSLLVCFQGHPEYEDTTLLKEYRRDVGRFLRGEHADWPAVPHGYFPPRSLEVLASFRDRVGCARDPGLLVEFPMAELTARVRADWRPAAVGIYRNWLSLVAAAKESTPRRHLVQL
jgi:homoserine O-succinyltransferase/O-acetyltransferase